ncbi:MAG: ATP-dependent Clp protease adaptor ClpS [Abitibacteriaceae bacterium]|nr:ATP-dependent Clp protease adaptor ClpS [Abditibacteriaceae bacterium]
MDINLVRIQRAGIYLENAEVEELTIPKTWEREFAAPEETNLSGYRVILYNDDWHSMDEVIFQLQKATGCNIEKAMSIMLEAHTKGRAPCYHGSREDCQRVARVLREIRLQVEVDCD